MKTKILNWLKYDRSFDSGVRLYHEYGSNMMLKRNFNQSGDTPYNNQLLIDELVKISEVDPLEVKAICSQPASFYKRPAATEQVAIPETEPITEEPPTDNTTELKTNLPETIRKAIRLRDEFPFLKETDCPNELKILVADMLTAFDNYKEAHQSLFAAETEEEILQYSKDTVENYINNRLIWDELNHYKEHHEILGNHPIFTEMLEMNKISEMSIPDLIKLKNNLRSNISQVKTALKKAEKPELTFERTARLESKERLLAIVTEKIESA